MGVTNLTELKSLDSLMKKSKTMIFDSDTGPTMDYGTKEKALGIVYDGYTTLPKTYHEIFLDPLKKLITTEDYSGILHALDQSGDGPWGDWLASINQRRAGYQKEATHAFEESIADLYDGFLSMEERQGIKPPDYETVSPLVKWGSGPYTWPADTGIKLGMNMAVVSMPPAYSQNIALWAPLGHETGGHDILHADKGLLAEIGKVVTANIMKHKNDPALKKQVVVNGRKMSIAKFGALYWKFTLDEISSDVCGLLNYGPAAGVGLANLLIPLRGGKLIAEGPTSDVHPIDAVRLLVAADVIRNIPDLDVKTADVWADALERIVDKYISNKTEFKLGSITRIPYDGMSATAKIVAQTIAFTPFDSLEGHCLSEINTWDNSDEELTTRIAEDFLDKKQPSLNPSSTGDPVYAAHIISAGVLATAESADVPNVTDLAITTLSELYDNNPVWRGFPVRFRSNAHIHKLV